MAPLPLSTPARPAPPGRALARLRPLGLLLAAALTLTACSTAAGGASDAASPASSAGSTTSPATGSASVGTSPGTSPDGSAEPAPSTSQTASELPRGGRTLGTYRLFGYSGLTGAPALGRLGIGSVDDRVVEMEKRAQPFLLGRPVMPVLEVITAIVHSTPSRTGKYYTVIPDAQIDSYLAAARRHKALLLLNIQPGREDFLPIVKGLEKYLIQPDVGVALDPEWAVGPGQIPGRVFGRTSGPELNTVASYLSGLVTKHGLPEKAMVVHQLHMRIITDEAAWKPYPGVVAYKSVDGIGSPDLKRESWALVVATNPPHVKAGFKLFYEEDVERGQRLMTAAEVMALRPQPEYILFE